ncbi:unnamed protein product [Dicrocoelium dendriticum]|nr:unnamed protein product [Dicrocoelium dendriticum]
MTTDVESSSTLKPEEAVTSDPSSSNESTTEPSIVSTGLDVQAENDTDAHMTNAAAPPENNFYHPPDWALPCPVDSGYYLEVIKNGVPLLDCTVQLSGVPSDTDTGLQPLSFCLVGRQPQQFYIPSAQLKGQCAVMAHPSVSRLHAVFQYGQAPPNIACTSCTSSETPGWYIQDLDSTHGTFINKRRLPAGRCVRVHVGYVIRFGGSTRHYVLQGPEDDIAPETNETWTELKEAYLARQQAARERPTITTPLTQVSLGCDWGISAEDANTDGPNFAAAVNGAACLSYERLYQDDPKRALKAYFEREGIEPAPEYEFVDASFGKQHCKIDLPLATGTVTAEVIVSGKRKEAMAACALEACHLLDRLGEFDPNKDSSANAKRIRSKEYWQENDYYSSDEDPFVDRTGQIEMKRLSRIRQLGVEGKEAEDAEKKVAEITKADKQPSNRLDHATMLALLSDLEKVGQEIVSLEEQLDQINKRFAPQGENPSELDELEAYMNGLKSGAPTRKERLKLRSRLFILRQLEARLFRQAGLPQPRHVAPSRPQDTDHMKAFEKPDVAMRMDAAAAVRAAKRKLEADPSKEVANVGDGDTQARSKNSRLTRDEIKRSLPSHRSRHVTRPTLVEQSAFSGSEEEDDEDNDETKAGELVEKHVGRIQSPIDKTTTSSAISAAFDDTYESRPIGTTNSPQPTSEKSAEEILLNSLAVEHSKSVSEAKYLECPVIEENPTESPLGSLIAETQQPRESDQISRPGRRKVPDVYELHDPDYVTWVPPPDQQGDGVTQLNAKYGY